LNVLTESESMTNLLEMTLKKQLKLYLEENGWSGTELGRRSKVSQQVISLWLKGGEPRKMSQVKKVADCFKISVDHLCFGEGLHEKEKPLGEIADNWISGVFEIKVRKIRNGGVK
jgi:transcriptional regulator with XRE-family HTH domain